MQEAKEAKHLGLIIGRAGSLYLDQYPAHALFPPNSFQSIVLT